MTKRGRLFVVEGPKASGKTTVAEALARKLPSIRGRQCSLLSQPSDTPLGRLLRSGEAEMRGHAYALALASDRLFQYETIILPLLEAGTDVVMARYTPSSLVLQHIDGVPIRDIWAYNQRTPAPDLLVYLFPPSNTLQQRLARRNHMTRIQALSTPELEQSYYDEAYALLEELGWDQWRFLWEGPVEEQADRIIAQIQKRFEED